MGSWIYVFSQFTEEALVIEGLTICVLTAAYTVFWTYRKRRLGSAKDSVPSHLVRAHLNQLIQEAQIIRTQLFGLLAENGVSHAPGALQAAVAQAGPSLTVAPSPAPVDPAAAAATAAAVAADPALGAKLKELEQKLNDQAQSAAGLQADKAKLEAELAQLKAGGAAPAGAPASGGADTSALEKKVKDLEEKLAEYNIIEDDLANLKRLQQENAQLKASLEKSAGGAPAVAAAAAAAAAVAPAAAEAPKPGPAFEAVVDQVEKAMEPAAAAAPAPAPSPTPAPEAAAAPAAPAAAPAGEKTGKNDEDLLAEFEKMLNM